MMKRKGKRAFLACATALLLALSMGGCGSSQAAQGKSSETGAAAGTTAETSMKTAMETSTEITAGKAPTKLQPLRIGLMPAVDAAPILLADKKGYFKELGLDVEAKIYTNAMNRQSALQSGELDGSMSDVIALLTNVQNGFAIKATSSTDGSFPFLTGPSFDKESGSLKAGMMEVSVTNYLSDAALSASYELQKVYINEIPLRLQAVGSGQIDLAVVPEPMASMGELQGMEKLVFPLPDAFSPDLFIFTDQALQGKTEEIAAFYQAYNKAAAEINQDDGPARDLLIEKLQLKAEIKDKILMPQYKKAQLPDQAYMQKIADWIENHLGQAIDLNYGQLVDSRFVEP